MSLHHLVREPKVKLDKNPVLFLLHGYGSNEEDLFSFAPEISADFFIVSARAPYDMQPYGAAWYAINFDATGGKFSDNEQAQDSMNLLLTFIKQLSEHYPINSKDINLLGFSQGAILSFGLSLSYPQIFNRVIAMSGYINEDLIQFKDGLASRFRDLGCRQAGGKTPQYFISHGTMDQVVPYEWAARSPAFLDKIGANYHFKDYPIGHGVARDNFYDMKNWLEA